MIRTVPTPEQLARERRARHARGFRRRLAARRSRTRTRVRWERISAGVRIDLLVVLVALVAQGAYAGACWLLRVPGDDLVAVALTLGAILVAIPVLVARALHARGG